MLCESCKACIWGRCEMLGVGVIDIVCKHPKSPDRVQTAMGGVRVCYKFESKYGRPNPKYRKGLFR